MYTKYNKLFFKIILMFIFLANSLHAAYLKNVPQILVQPDGDTLRCFASGDEFYHWLHDEHNFTIVQDPETGYWVYADKQNDKLVPSNFIVGKTDPATVSLQPGLKISKQEYLARRQIFYEETEAVTTPTTGTINNICIFIRFNNETEFSDPRSIFNSNFNSTSALDNSMRNYYSEVSYQQLTISSTFYPTCATTTNLSYQDSHTRNYYQIYNQITNPIGYPENDKDERKEREHNLLRDAVNFVSSQIPSTLNIDANNDGEVDNVCFIIRTGTISGAILWAHFWHLSSYEVTINGKEVNNYTIQLESEAMGTFCHEMFHSLGAPDLYHYSYDGVQPVANWDIMENNQDPPQHMGSYMKYRYGQWISSLPLITVNGIYSLNSLLSSYNNAYAIRSNNTSDEYFVVEYRQRSGTFENSLPGSGLLVYRINTDEDGEGNKDGPPDEVYIYRPNGYPNADGNPDDAYFTKDVDRTYMNDYSNPSAFLSDGSPGGLFIADVSRTGNTISFYVACNYQIVSGMVFDGFGGAPFDPATGNTYWARNDLVTPYGLTATGKNGTILYIEPGKKLSGSGLIHFEAGNNWSNIFVLDNYRTGIKAKGQIKIHDGGAIKLF